MPADAVAQPVLPLVATPTVRGIVVTHSSFPGVVGNDVVIMEVEVAVLAETHVSVVVITQYTKSAF